MKETRKDLYPPSGEYRDTFEETQRLIIKELYTWMASRCKTLDEGWDSLQIIQRMGQFIVDYADKKDQAYALRRILDMIARRGKPVQRKVTLPTGLELTLDNVVIEFDMFELVAYVRSLVSSAIDGHREEQKWMHRGVAKMRVNMHNKELHKQIDEGNL